MKNDRPLISPLVLRKRLANGVRRFGTTHGYKPSELARILRMDLSSVSRILRGEVGAKPQTIMALRHLAQTADEMARLEELEEVAQLAASRGFWIHFGGRKGIPSYVADYIEAEFGAASIRSYDPVVPGLCQTEGYARALIEMTRSDRGEVERLVDLRIARQGILARTDVFISFVIDECALRRRVGGNDVMRPQLARLEKVAGLPNVTLQILPAEAAEAASVGAGFVIFDFDPSVELDPIAYVESPTVGSLREEAAEVASCSAAFERLKRASLSPAESLRVLEKLGEHYGRG